MLVEKSVKHSMEMPTSTEIPSKKKAKIIFMGNANVGKTSIINSFLT